MEFFFKQGGQEGGDRNKPFKSSLRELHKDRSTKQIREWIYSAPVLCSPGPHHRSRHRGFPQAPSAVPRDKNYLHNNTKLLFAFFTVWPICRSRVQALVGKIPDTSAGKEAEARTCQWSLCSLLLWTCRSQDIGRLV